MKRTPFTHYLVLFAILAAGIASFLYVRPNVTYELGIGIATTVAYIFWGIMHHTLQKDLHQKIVVEYLLMGAIAIVLLVTMLGF